jgi:hypothetical protein
MTGPMRAPVPDGLSQVGASLGADLVAGGANDVGSSVLRDDDVAFSSNDAGDATGANYHCP